MERFDIHVLGCGSASPTSRHYPSSQVVNHNDRLFMFDCGEGTQMQFRYMKLKFSRLNHIFLSHLHGDHCFGLIGLISTMGLLGRTSDLFVYAHPEAERVFAPVLSFFCKELPFTVRFMSVLSGRGEPLYEDKRIIIRSFPLKHRIPTVGFLVEEKPRLRHICKEMADHYRIPLSSYLALKEGADYVDPSTGETIANSMLTTPSVSPLRYAYCSDTAYSERIIPYIEGVDLLYHEATFASDNQSRAKETFHSTALQAAQIARKANVKRLLIGHYSARYHDERVLLKEAQTEFSETVLATDSMTIALR